MAGVVAVHQIPVEHVHVTSIPDGVDAVAVDGMLTLKEMLSRLTTPRPRRTGSIGIHASHEVVPK